MQEGSYSESRLHLLVALDRALHILAIAPPLQHVFPFEWFQLYVVATIFMNRTFDIILFFLLCTLNRAFYHIPQPKTNSSLALILEAGKSKSHVVLSLTSILSLKIVLFLGTDISCRGAWFIESGSQDAFNCVAVSVVRPVFFVVFIWTALE